MPFRDPDELLWILLSEKELKEINTQNCAFVARRIHEVDLGSVSVCNLQMMTREYMGYTDDLLSSHPPLLSRCRSLRELHLGILSENFSFRWAVDEELASNRRNALDRALDPALPKEPQLALIPLEVISMQIPFSPRNWIDDIDIAFGDTLKEIKAEIYVADGNIEDIPTLRVGQGWNLPQIHTVSISSDDVRLLIDPDLLRGMGENLENMKLQDKSHRHQCRDFGLISPPSNPLPKLHTISLHGGPAVLFHPDNLQKTLSLKNLILRTEPGDVDASLEQEFLGRSAGYTDPRQSFFTLDLELEPSQSKIPVSLWRVCIQLFISNAGIVSFVRAPPA